jgi:hypothetical protein
MRSSALIVLTLCLITGSAMGQQTNGQGSLHRSFASTNCPQQTPCPGDASSSVSDLASVANECVTQGFNIRDGGTFFDDTSTLDADSCLTLATTAQTAKINPRCCIRQLQDSSCILHCDLSN